MGRQSLVRASRVVAAGTLMASIAVGSAAVSASASSGGVGAPRTVRGARLNGDLNTSRLIMEEGATFIGMSNITPRGGGQKPT